MACSRHSYVLILKFQSMLNSKHCTGLQATSGYGAKLWPILRSYTPAWALRSHTCVFCSHIHHYLHKFSSHVDISLHLKLASIPGWLPQWWNYRSVIIRTVEPFATLDPIHPDSDPILYRFKIVTDYILVLFYRLKPNTLCIICYSLSMPLFRLKWSACLALVAFCITREMHLSNKY